MSNELILVNYENENPTVLGRDLHEKLGIKEQYRDWMNRMIGYGFISNADYITFSGKSENVENRAFGDTTNIKPKINHQLTLEMAKHIAMVQRSKIGMDIRNYFIEIEKQSRLNTPKTYKEALIALIAIEEQKEKLLLQTQDDAKKKQRYIGGKGGITANRNFYKNKTVNLENKIDQLEEEIGFNRKYATVKKVEMYTKRKFRWKPLKDHSKQYELEIKKVPDVNYGHVNCYHADAWYNCYNIDLETFFD
jgi:phage anti-repressor protein